MSLWQNTKRLFQNYNEIVILFGPLVVPSRHTQELSYFVLIWKGAQGNLKIQKIKN